MATIIKVRNKRPNWGKNCFIAENATLVGNIIMGDDCSIWFSAVLRADVDAIHIGDRVNIQDGACVHESHGTPVWIEDDVSVGHLANVHGCVIRQGALIGMGATVLDGAEIGAGAIIAANALVTQGTHVGAHEIWLAYLHAASKRQCLDRQKNMPNIIWKPNSGICKFISQF